MIGDTSNMLLDIYPQQEFMQGGVVRINKQSSYGLGLAIAGACLATPAGAIDLTSGDWKFTVNGNVNVDYVYSSCESSASAQPIVTVGGACTGSGNGSDVSNVGNGLLPAALVFGVSTTQSGFDIGAHFGLYPGVDTNDGGSPNLQQGAPSGTNVALGTTGLDVRQVYMTFGNKDIGTFTFGRNFGLFGFDAIINDMTIPGVGVAGSMSTASPANTSLGSIGFGYIYCDTLAQMNYTTPDFAGFNVTVGIYDPLNSLTDPGTAEPKRAPGFQGKITYTTTFAEGVKLYLSSAFITQKLDSSVTTDIITGATQSLQYSGRGIDANAKLDVSGFSFLLTGYHANGLGTTGLFVLSSDGLGNSRESYGYLAQATYTVGAVKLGVNYGVSRLDFANGTDAVAVPDLLDRNSKVTGGVYYSLTKNLTLLTEISNVETRAHNDNENKSTNANVGAFLSF